MQTKNNIIVSAEHLAQGKGASLSEIEYSIIIASHSMQSWVVRCMISAGGPDKMTYLDALVLHNVYHRERSKRLADICFTYNISDTHTVSYSLRKLSKFGLINPEKRGKETYYGISFEGKNVCNKYAEIRQQCLIEALEGTIDTNISMHESARLLRTLSGLYDQAGRAASSL
jgi:predicted MarR family transcription regulator